MMSVPVLAIFITLLKVNLVISAAEESHTQLLQVHLITRHGARTPTSYCDNDKSSQRTFTEAPGELTHNGKMMMYNLGKILRQEYNILLGDLYDNEIIKISSSGTTRTNMSANLILNGLWAPTKDDFTEELLVPHYQDHIVTEKYLSSKVCDFALQIIHPGRLGENGRNHIAKHKVILETIRKDCVPDKSRNTEIRTLRDFLDYFSSWKALKEHGETLPNWAETLYPQLQPVMHEVYPYVNINPVMKKIISGFTLNKIKEEMENKMKEPTKNPNMFLYSVHDIQVGCLLDALGAFNNKMVEYGATVIFELRKSIKSSSEHQQSQSSEYFIRLRYLNGPPPISLIRSSQDIEIMTLDYVSFEDFFKRCADVLPDARETFTSLCAETPPPIDPTI